MSSRDVTRPQDVGPGRLKPAQGAPILDASVEAEGRVSDLCTGTAPRDLVRARILAWLAEGAREVSWALSSLRRERWVKTPPPGLGDWPALRHVRHLALREKHQLLPVVSRADGQRADALSVVELDEADAAWDPASESHSAEAIVNALASTRFELLQRLEIHWGGASPAM